MHKTMTKDDFYSYAGSVTEVIHDSQPSLKFTPDGSGNSRHVSIQQFIPPIQISGWLRPSFHSQSDNATDGLHIHVGHIGNERNYVASIVRRDGNQKIAVEYGWKEYKTLDDDEPDGVTLKWERTYMFTVLWQHNRITSWVGNEVERSSMSARIPGELMIPSGAIGVRLDEMSVLGALVIRSV